MPNLTQFSDDELQASFRKHSLRGMVISLSLLVSFLVLYYSAATSNIIVTTVFVIISVASVALAIWYHVEKRKYFQEFKRRRNA